MKLIIFIKWFVLFVAVSNHQSWKSVLVTKICLCQKNQKHPLNENYGQKKTWRPRFLEYAEHHVFRLLKITFFEADFFFFGKGTFYFVCIKANDFR